MAEKIQPCFSERVEVRFSREGTESNRHTFDITTEVYTRHRSPSIQLLLTDPADHLFLYVMAMDEQNYEKWKEKEQMHASFTEFPQSFRGVLHRCMQDTNKCNSEEPSSSSALLVHKSDEWYTTVHLHGSDATIKVVQEDHLGKTNRYTLTLTRASDEQHKKYLAEKLKSYENENDKLTEQLQYVTAEAATLRQDLQQCRDESGEKIIDLDKQLKIQQREHELVLGSYKENHERDLQATTTGLKQKYQLQLQQLQSELEKATQELQESRSHSGSTSDRLRSLEHSLERKSEEHVRLQQEHQKLRQELTSLQRTHNECGNAKEEYALQINQLSHKVDLKEAEIKSLKEGLSKQEVNDVHIKENSELLKTHNETLQMELKDKDAKYQKALLVIGKCNAKHLDLQRKYQIKSEKLKNNQHEAKQREYKMVELKEKNAHLQERTGDLESNVRRCESEINSQKSTLADLQKELNERKQAADFLNSQLTDAQTGKRNSTVRIGPTTSSSLLSSSFNHTRAPAAPQSHNPIDALMNSSVDLAALGLGLEDIQQSNQSSGTATGTGVVNYVNFATSSTSRAKDMISLSTDPMKDRYTEHLQSSSVNIDSLLSKCASHSLYTHNKHPSSAHPAESAGITDSCNTNTRPPIPVSSPNKQRATTTTTTTTPTTFFKTNSSEGNLMNTFNPQSPTQTTTNIPSAGPGHANSAFSPIHKPQQQQQQHTMMDTTEITPLKYQPYKAGTISKGAQQLLSGLSNNRQHQQPAVCNVELNAALHGI